MSPIEQAKVTHPIEVWQTLDQKAKQKIVDELHRITKEIMDDHFRISTSPTPQSAGCDLHTTIESKPSRHQQGKPAHAVRAA